jgi:hypothetical protein
VGHQPAGAFAYQFNRVTAIFYPEDRLYGPLGEIVQETRAIPTLAVLPLIYVTRFQYGMRPVRTTRPFSQRRALWSCGGRSCAVRARPGDD